MKKLKYHHFLILIISVALLGILVATVFSWKFTRRLNEMFLSSNTRQVTGTIDMYLKLHKNNLEKIVFDYSYWDDLVKFIEKKDEKWANDYLNSVPSTFEFDACWIYNERKNNIYNATRPQGVGLQAYRIPDNILDSLYNKRFIHYFTKSSWGILEIHGATVHPTEDVARKTDPKGYFIIAKKWDTPFLKEIEDLLVAQVVLSDRPEENENQGENIITSKQLLDFKGEVLTNILVKREFKDIKTYNKTVKYLFIIILVAILFVFITIIRAIQVLVRNPLNLLEEILKEQEASKIAVLRKYGGKFSHIGRLMDEFFNQRIELITAKEKAEENDQMRAMFLSKMSYDIRTPLNGIIGFTELLSESELNEAKREEYRKKIRDCSKELLSIIDRQITLASGPGGEFYHDVPYAGKHEAEPMPEPVTPAEMHQKKRIQLIEDDEVTAYMIREILESAGFELKHARDPYEGLREIQKDPPDLVLMDVKLPGMDGWEASKLIHSAHPKLPIIAQTAFATANDRRKADEAGCDDYIAKPYTPKELLRIIARNLP